MYQFTDLSVETCASNVGNSEALHALFYDLSKSMIEDKLTTDQLKDVIKDVMVCIPTPYRTV